MQAQKHLLLGTVAALALTTQAFAVQISNITVGGVNVGTGSYNLASEITFTTATSGSSTGANIGTMSFQVNPTTGNLPSGNVLLNVALTGATFVGTISGTNVTPLADVGGAPGCGVGFTSVISTGGGAGTSNVVFVLSGLNGCDTTAEGVTVTLPVNVAAAPGSVNVTAGFTTTDASPVPIDGPAVTETGAITVASAFAPIIMSSFMTGTGSVVNGPSILTIASGFTQFSTATGADTLIGQAWFLAGSSVFANLAGVSAGSANIGTGSITVSGDFTGFSSSTASTSSMARLIATGAGAPTSCPTTVGSNPVFTIGTGTALGTATLALSSGTNQGLVGGANAVEICVVPGTGSSAAVLNASTYTGSFTANYIDLLTGTETGTGTLGPITREGTTVVFPWVSSGTQATATGSSNVIRLGNTSSTAITGLFFRVLNQLGTAPTTLFAIPPAGSTTAAIPANGERVITGAELETILGANFVRGDIEFVIEALGGNLTARRFVFNGTSFTELAPGTIGTGPQ